MNNKFKFSILTGLLAAFASTPSVPAQSVEILGITNDGQRAQLKARVDLNGKTPSGVTAYSYNMDDGYTVTNRTYELVTDGTETYLSADVFYYPGGENYTHRVEINFTDGTNCLSPVVTEDLSEAFMWLGDYPFAEATSEWAGHPAVVDKCVNPSVPMAINGKVYYKGISTNAAARIIYKFDNADFTRFVTHYGMQDNEINGDVNFRFYTGTDASRTEIADLTLQGQQRLNSRDHVAPNDYPCEADITIDMDGVKVLRFELDNIDNYWGDASNLVLARLYLPVTGAQKKQQQVTFTTPSSTLNGPITLNSTSSSNGKIFYRIISGSEYATINNGVLSPIWGAKGTVIVEATQFGTDDYFPATAYQTFTVDMMPAIEMLDVYRPTISADGKSYVYIYVDTKGKALDVFDATFYNNARNRKQAEKRNLLSKLNTIGDPKIVELELSNDPQQVVRVAYRFSGYEKVDSLPYWHNEGSFDYMSDLPFTNGNGYGAFPGANKSFGGDNGNVLAIGSNSTVLNTYAKGFGLHANGWIEIAPTVLAPYNRVVLDLGSQYPQGYTNQRLTFELLNGNTMLAQAVDALKPAYQQWDYQINNQQKLRVNANTGSDGNSNDHVCIGAPRLYYSPVWKSAQTIEWDNARTIINNGQSTVDLGATASTGYPVYYRIVKGTEYADIVDGKLLIKNFPAGGAQIVVDAYQPGDNVWAPAEVKTCVFSLIRGLEVNKGESIELNGPDILDRLIVHADKSSSGEVTVKKGIVEVRTIELKYTFVPGEWTHIAFPSDLNIEKISNLKDLGYSFNAFNVPSYFIKEFDTAGFASETTEDGWKMLDAPTVKGMKGYIMSIDNSLTDEPVEVTFTIENSTVDLINKMRALGLTVDFSEMQPGATQMITVTSANPDVRSNELTVEVAFEPTSTSSLPLNHVAALEKMRYTFVGGNKAIRLTLPDQTPARVVFFDKKGKKMVKAVKYVSPNVIDLRDLPSGQYNMVVGYGPATRTLTIDL